MQPVTGTRDHTYDLVSVLYHLLQGAETYAQYIQDAEHAGDKEAADFFRELLEQDREKAMQAKALLKARLGASQAEGSARTSHQKARDEVEQASMESFPASDAPQHY